MKSNFKLLLLDKIIKYSLFASVFLILFQLIIAGLFLTKLPPLIPLLNSKPWGNSRLYPSITILLIPLLLIVGFIVNNLLSAVYYKTNTLAARILSFNSLLFILLSLLALVQIIFLVF